MSRTQNGPRAMHWLPLSAAALLLASCGSVPLSSLFTRPTLPPISLPVRPPAEAHEIPVPEPNIARPAPAQLTPLQLAMVNNPPARPPTPVMKPMPPPDTEAVAPGALLGSDFTSVRLLLREPDTVQKSALSVVWTYAGDCTFQLYFYPDIKTRIFRVLKYDLKDGSGEKPANSSICMRSIMVANNDEPNSP